MSLLPYVQPGNAISLTVPFADSNGVPLVGSQIASLNYGVFDSFGDDLIGLTTFPLVVPYSTEGGLTPGDDDMVVQYPTPTEVQPGSSQSFLSLAPPGPKDTGVTISIPPNYNVLPSAYPDPDYAIKTDIAIEDVREVRVNLTLTTGNVITINAYYRIVQSAQELLIVQNSFQTYAQALLTGDRMPDLSGFVTASRPQRIAALKEGYTRLTRFGYFVRWPRDPDAQNYLDWYENRNAVIIPRLWVAMTDDRWFNFYPEVFREAMRRAQLYEADDILTADPFAKLRDHGVVRQKIGETDVEFLKPKTVADSIGLSDRTMRALSGYLNLRTTIGRV